MDFVLFVVPGWHYSSYTTKAHIGAFQTMYFLSSFFNQFGPNSTTFLVAAEVYPTPVRATAHGVSAAAGKLGALTAAVVFTYIDIVEKFHFVPWFGLAGMIVTFIFLPDTTGLDLKEQERRFEYIRAGREHEYHGIAAHPHHLSVWERFRGAGKSYNPELDYIDKVKDIREEWTNRQAEKVASDDLIIFDDEYPPEIHEYFVRTSSVPVVEKKKSPLGSGADSDETSSEKNEKNEKNEKANS
jgi:hypothetical protein